jgi:hypothetical protein
MEGVKTAKLSFKLNQKGAGGAQHLPVPRTDAKRTAIAGSAHCEYVYANPRLPAEDGAPRPGPRAARPNRLLWTTRVAARRRLGQAPPPAAIRSPPQAAAAAAAAAAAVIMILLLRPEATATSSARRAPPPEARPPSQ